MSPPCFATSPVMSERYPSRAAQNHSWAVNGTTASAWANVVVVAAVAAWLTASASVTINPPCLAYSPIMSKRYPSRAAHIHSWAVNGTTASPPWARLGICISPPCLAYSASMLNRYPSRRAHHHSWTVNGTTKSSVRGMLDAT
mmetsp:Transcript_16809/g.31460  ORF Transcript_16809/g.31460 Transcript_16809/m.31460 type:complete len:143 (+) Transcript_16809:271-699(+)